MSQASRTSTYVLSGIIGAVCGFLFPFLLYGLSHVIPESVAKGLATSILYASTPAFRFGSAIGARMGALLILVILYWMAVGMVAGLGSVWLHFRLLHKTGGTRRDWLTVALVLSLVLSSVIVSRATRNYRIFRRYVLKPIPRSVEQIRTHRPWEGSGHRYVMRFKISKADVGLILKSRPFEEFDRISYDDGSLSLRHAAPPTDVETPDQIDFGKNLFLYDAYHGESGLEWFKPNDWSHPKVYWFHEKHGRSERSHEQVLIYNEQLGEAYFIEYLWGTW
jgi:hypothetical protein